MMGGAVFCALAILLLAPVGAAVSEEVLLIPVPGTGDLSAGFRPEPQDIKVLSRMTIRKGDSLWRIARRKWGRGDFYPFLLAINTIANPDLIYYGRSLLLPAGTLDRHPELASRLSGKTAKIVFPPPATSSQIVPRAAPRVHARPERAPARAEVRAKKPRALPATGQRKDSGEEAEVWPGGLLPIPAGHQHNSKSGPYLLRPVAAPASGDARSPSRTGVSTFGNDGKDRLSVARRLLPNCADGGTARSGEAKAPTGFGGGPREEAEGSSSDGPAEGQRG